jgi:hypothetical protein
MRVLSAMRLSTGDAAPPLPLPSSLLLLLLFHHYHFYYLLELIVIFSSSLQIPF